jgi:hypothetical protein
MKRCLILKKEKVNGISTVHQSGRQRESRTVWGGEQVMVQTYNLPKSFTTMTRPFKEFLQVMKTTASTILKHNR